jgi:hypothetical protein
MSLAALEHKLERFERDLRRSGLLHKSEPVSQDTETEVGPSNADLLDAMTSAELARLRVALERGGPSDGGVAGRVYVRIVARARLRVDLGLPARSCWYRHDDCSCLTRALDAGAGEHGIAALRALARRSHRATAGSTRASGAMRRRRARAGRFALKQQPLLEIDE